MRSLEKTIAVGASSLFVLSGASGASFAATQAEASYSPASVEEQTVQKFTESEIVCMDEVVGEFAYTQAAIASNDVIKRNIADASQYMCGAHVLPDEDVAAGDWIIAVNGDVADSYAASFDDLANSSEVQTIMMGCTCASNPTDGRASVNAEVTGISALVLIGMASPNETANTVVFTSADGYQVELPFDYLKTHYCPVVFDVNGAPLAESVGGINQLWLGSTAASYFARDIVSITLEERQTPPPSPNSDEAREAYQNLPNVGVLLGGEVK